jgi:hypothetical protein
MQDPPVDASTEVTAFDYVFDSDGPVYLVVDSPAGSPDRSP